MTVGLQKQKGKDCDSVQGNKRMILASFRFRDGALG